MEANQRWLDVIANNLANASTTGFKRDGLTFTDALEREVRSDAGQGADLGSISGGVHIDSGFTVFDNGPVSQTGRSLDIAIDDPKGMLAVQTAQGTRYTRNGALTINGKNQLVTQEGDPILSDGGQPIVVTPGPIDISPNGQVNVGGQSVGKLGIYSGTFQKEGNSLYSSSDAKTLSNYTVSPSSLEGSNVNPVQSMVEMITVNRAYELSQKSIQSQDDMTQKLISSLSSR